MSENKLPETDLNQIATAFHQRAKEKGFWDTKREIGTLLMLIVSELSEALEADRRDKKNMLQVFERDLTYAGLLSNSSEYQPDNINYEWITNRFETTIKDTFEDEIADVFIRLFDLCGALNIDIDKHIALKMEYNQSRAHKHGKAY